MVFTLGYSRDLPPGDGVRSWQPYGTWRIGSVPEVSHLGGLLSAWSFSNGLDFGVVFGFEDFKQSPDLRALVIVLAGPGVGFFGSRWLRFIVR